MAVTPNYGLNLPAPTDSMANVGGGFNNAWTIIKTMPSPKAVVGGSVLPTTGYNVGDVIHLSGWKSNFILIANDAHWGYMWRPIHAKFGPWIDLGITILEDNTNYGPSTNGHMAYRLSNDGKIAFTGGILTSLSAWPTGTSSTSFFFPPPPVACPMVNSSFEVTMNKHGMGVFKGNTSAFFQVNKDGSNFLRVYNNATGVGGAGDADEITFNEVVWAMGTRTNL